MGLGKRESGRESLSSRTAYIIGQKRRVLARSSSKRKKNVHVSLITLNENEIDYRYCNNHRAGDKSDQSGVHTSINGFEIRVPYDCQ